MLQAEQHGLHADFAGAKNPLHVIGLIQDPIARQTIVFDKSMKLLTIAAHESRFGNLVGEVV
jgi:hypothetical protein